MKSKETEYAENYPNQVSSMSLSTGDAEFYEPIKKDPNLVTFDHMNSNAQNENFTVPNLAGSDSNLNYNSYVSRRTHEMVDSAPSRVIHTEIMKDEEVTNNDNDTWACCNIF